LFRRHGKWQSSGFGLAIVKQIMALHHGLSTLENTGACATTCEYPASALPTILYFNNTSSAHTRFPASKQTQGAAWVADCSVGALPVLIARRLLLHMIDGEFGSCCAQRTQRKQQQAQPHPGTRWSCDIVLAVEKPTVAHIVDGKGG
jgi:hypothetical protein